MPDPAIPADYTDPSTNWRNLYERALLEGHPDKLAEKISVARCAILDRAEEIMTAPGGAESRDLTFALRVLLLIASQPSARRMPPKKSLAGKRSHPMAGDITAGPKPLRCAICHDGVDLETAHTDEYGQAVHELCYVVECMNKRSVGSVRFPCGNNTEHTS